VASAPQPHAPPSAPRPVVAVLVTHDAPEERFDQVLRALAAQDYPNLDVLVVDTGAHDPTQRVHTVLPAARVHRVDGDPGYGEAANIVLDLVSGAEFYVFAHDDAAPDPDAVSALVAAADRWGADIVGPKLVQWDAPRRFTQFGMTVDKVGVALPFVERGELDQGQHDGLRNVFAVPGAFTLVRAARFAEIGGFDEAISFLGDDLSLAWRARLAGAKVLVTSAARVRHAEAFAGRPDGAAAVARLAARHRVRVLLSSYRLSSLILIVPQALVLSVIEAVGAVVTGRPARARGALGAWPWNLWQLPSLVAARREVRGFRTVGDRDVHRHQVRGLVGPRLTLRRVGAGGGSARFGTSSRRVAAVPVRGKMDVDPAAWSPGTALVALTVAGVVVLGSRHLLTRYVPVVGELVPAGGGVGDLLGAWAGGWRPVGLGADGATPGVTGALGLLGTVLFGQVGLARTLLTVGLVPVGVVGAHRLLAPSGSKRAQVAAAVAYAAVPLPYDALATGRWAALAAYAGAPWMLGRLARASGVTPFAPSTGPLDAPIAPAGVADELVVGHRLWKHVVATGVVTAATGLLVPQAPLLLVVMGVALVLGSLLAGEVRGTLRVLVAAGGGAAVAAVLGLPTTLDVVTTPGGVDAWLGAGRDAAGLTASDILAFRTGPAELAVVGLALLGAAAVPLLVGRRWRLGWAARGWAVAVAGWGVVWAGERGWITVRRPDPGVPLAAAAAGLALAVGLGLAAIEHDVRGRSWRFGARRLVAGVGLLALVGSTVAAVVASTDGWWNMPRDDFAGIVGFADDDVRATPARVLWVGDDELIPGGDGWPLGGDLAFTASTAQAVPGVADLWPATADGASARLGDALTLALDHDTTRLGRVLAPMGVRYIAIPRRLAPGDDTVRATHAQVEADRAADALAGALAEQLDLQQVRIDPGLVLYRNTAALPLRAAFPDGVTDDPSGAEAVLREDVGARSAQGTVPGDATVVQASTASDQWQLRVEDAGEVEHSTAYGWADSFAVTDGGAAHLAYRTPLGIRALVAAQAALWLSALAVALRMRFGPGDAPSPEGPAVVDDEPEAARAADQAPRQRVLVGQAGDA
jgi:GT2 family glycosyltransferase